MSQQVNEYDVYKTDLRYRNNRKLSVDDYNRLDKKYHHLIDVDMDNVEYRLRECMEGGGKVLDLSHLNLRTFPIKTPLTVEELYMHGNNFESQLDFSQLKSLKILDISNNQLSVVPLLPLTVEELVCKSNSIHTLPDHLPFLRKLDCENNKITIIPLYLELEILIGSENIISKIPIMPKLKKLIIRKNKLIRILAMPYLHHIDCTFNKIIEIEPTSMIEEIYCDNNRIRSISGFSNLRSLSCYNNPLKAIYFMPKLTELICDYRSIKIDREFKIKRAKRGDKIIQIIFHTQS